MLRAAAERGVNVNVIVYKEVPQALTRKLSHLYYLFYEHLRANSLLQWIPR